MNLAWLDGWDPKVIRGERAGRAIPTDPEERQEFRIGFEAGLDGKPRIGPRVGTVSSRDFVKGGMRAEDHLPHADLSRMSKAWRDGYAVGREVRGKSVEVALIYEALRRDLWKPPPPRQRRRDPDKGYAVKSRGPVGSGKGTFTHVGGPRLTVREVAWRFAQTDDKCHAGGALWTDGIVLYSYMQPIAKKRVRADALSPGNLGRICEVDPRRFSPTTTKHQGAVRSAVVQNGWRIEARNLGPPKAR